ncbi:MAG: hypothetical protein A2V77_11305 [Anaeromyxobacter sp. RBG_16_69_14]|nr:MAG: hypothetical protein A2V77_11305 [Anaeromyxobacter sp. RBG_16_69_14]
MLSLFSLLFALRFETATAPPDPLVISARAESRAIAVENELSASALLDPGREWNATLQSPDWPVAQPSAPGFPAPIFQAHQPEEWVSIVARQLNVGDKSVTQAAMRATAWFAAMPVRVDMTPRRVYVTVRFRLF